MICVDILQAGVNSHGATVDDFNAIATDFLTDGIVGAITSTAGVAPTTGGFAVNAQSVPNMSVAVSTGKAYITGVPTDGVSQRLRVVSDGAENVTIDANATGGTRYDWLYIKLDPDKMKDPATNASDVATLITSRSTSASTDNGTPPTYGYCLAVITVANGASSIVSANISDKRTEIIPVRSGSLPNSSLSTEVGELGGAFNTWSPTVSGWQSAPSGALYYYSRIGKMVTLYIRQPNDGTSNAVTKSITLPFPARSITNMVWSGQARIIDNGGATTFGLINISISVSATIASFYPGPAGGNWTASGVCRIVDAVLTYEVE